MKLNTKKYLLGAYDFALAIGAIYTGYLMISSNYGVFNQYPREWIGILPFHDWVTPGILAVCIFGIGNMIASILCFLKNSIRYWVASAVMGGILLLAMIFLSIILKEYYLATLEFVLLAMLQLFLCIYSVLKIKKEESL